MSTKTNRPTITNESGNDGDTLADVCPYCGHEPPCLAVVFVEECDACGESLRVEVKE